MFKQLIQRVGRILGGPKNTAVENAGVNEATSIHRSVAGGSSRLNRGRSARHRDGEIRHRDSDGVHRHGAERLLRDGHLRIAITGFNDTAFEVSIMRRHDSPELADAVSDLPCRIKMVDRRNIAAGLLSAINVLDDGAPGRRGVVLITSGDAAAERTRLQELATKAARVKIGIHVICVGADASDPVGAPRINTKHALGYGGFSIVETREQLLAAVRDAFSGLLPAFGMRGTNKAMILLDCSESMVEAFSDTSRIEIVATALHTFLRNPLVRSCLSPKATDAAASVLFRRGFERRPFVGCATH